MCDTLSIIAVSKGCPGKGLRDASPVKAGARKPFEPDPGRAGVGTGTAFGQKPPPLRMRPGSSFNRRNGDSHAQFSSTPGQEAVMPRSRSCRSPPAPFPASRKVYVAGQPPWRSARRDARDRPRSQRQRAAGARLRHLRPLFRSGHRDRYPHGACPNCASRWILARGDVEEIDRAARSSPKTTG